ncbi:MAG: S8/S53 family peptidase [Ignavibacteria bacterium]|nr:S8/S53 family peptidase [Ignavibacteria bacterium]
MNNEIIIWFQEGALNTDYLGCELLGKRGAHPRPLTELPLDTSFIYSQTIVNYLQTLGVAAIRKMIPAVNPCQDTVSYAVSGQVLRMPAFWNALVFRFNTGYDIPALAYGLVNLFSDKILWAQPNFKYTLLGGFGMEASQPTMQSYGVSPNDSMFVNKYQEHLKSRYVGQAWIDSIWAFTTGDSTVRIGCIDGGFDWRHPDLGGGAGPGYRVRGSWNYHSNTQNTYVGLNAYQVDHGTASLSVIGAISNNDSLGVAGICGGDSSGTSGAAMYALRATISGEVANAVWEASANTGSTPSFAGSGQLWQCDILSFSMTTGTWADTVGLGYKDEIVRAILAFRYQNGRTTFCAMGNGKHKHDLVNSETTYGGAPEDVDKEWVITVSAGDPYNVLCTEDFGDNLDILAPSSNAICYVDSG